MHPTTREAWLSSATLKIFISGVSSQISMLSKANLVYSSSRLRGRPQNEDNLKNKYGPKDKDNLKNEDNLKDEDALKMKTPRDMKTNTKSTQTQKLRHSQICRLPHLEDCTGLSLHNLSALVFQNYEKP